MKKLFFLRGLSLLLAAAVVAMTPFCVYNIELDLYLVWGVFVTLFCVLFFYTSKKAACNEGYTYFQAFLFSIDCNRKGISRNKLTSNKTKAKLMEIAKSKEFSKDFNEIQVIKLYLAGLDVIKELKMKG